MTFRPLARTDFALLGAWLAEPLVARWWNHESDAAAIERDFGPSLDGDDVAEYFLAFDERGPYGLIQRYPIAAYPEYVAELAAVVPLPPGAISVDYLIGEPDRRGRGLGAVMIAAYAALAWPRYPGAEAIVVPVSAANRASWRSLERAGFERVAEGELEPDNPADSRAHVVYTLPRPAAAASLPGG